MDNETFAREIQQIVTHYVARRRAHELEAARVAAPAPSSPVPISPAYPIPKHPFVSRSRPRNPTPVIDTFARALQQLSNKEQAMILMDVAGWSPDEIAAMCGLTYGTVRNALTILRARMQDLASRAP